MQRPALPAPRRLVCALACALLWAAPARGAPTDAPRVAPGAGAVVVSGVVPDEATRQSLLARVRELYGADRVVDQLGVAPILAPPQWAQHVHRMLGEELKHVSRGQLGIQGAIVELRGEVPNEALRQQVVAQLSSRIQNPTYTVRNGLRVVAAGQEQVDAALADRTIEFEPARATLTPQGQAVLDALWPVVQQLSGRRFEVIGHTDAQGPRSANVALSQARADTVRGYLVAKGLPAESIDATGLGPDRPVASNDTPEGRARNRRIEFRVRQ